MYGVMNENYKNPLKVEIETINRKVRDLVGWKELALKEREVVIDLRNQLTNQLTLKKQIQDLEARLEFPVLHCAGCNCINVSE